MGSVETHKLSQIYLNTTVFVFNFYLGGKSIDLSTGELKKYFSHTNSSDIENKTSIYTSLQLINNSTLDMLPILP